MRCPTCGFDADPAHALCPRCGTSLAVAHQPAAPWSGGHPPVGPVPSQPWPTRQVPQPGPWLNGQGHGQPPHNPWPAGNYEILEPGSGPGGRRPPWAWLVAVLAVILVSAGAARAILKLNHKLPKIGHTAPAARAAAP